MTSSNDTPEILTASHFVNQHLGFIDSFFTVQQRMAIEAWMIEFAQLHADLALKAASEKALIKGVYESGTVQLIGIMTKEGIRYTVDPKSILSSYPTENIK